MIHEVDEQITFPSSLFNTNLIRLMSRHQGLACSNNKPVTFFKQLAEKKKKKLNEIRRKQFVLLFFLWDFYAISIFTNIQLLFSSHGCAGDAKVQNSESKIGEPSSDSGRIR